jgi:hypothetical protein
LAFMTRKGIAVEQNTTAIWFDLIRFDFSFCFYSYLPYKVDSKKINHPVISSASHLIPPPLSLSLPPTNRQDIW